MEKTLGDRIKRLRKEQGMSVDELAKRIGKNRATVYRYEKGDIEGIPTTILDSLAEALHTDTSYLVGNKVKTSELPNNNKSIQIKLAQIHYALEYDELLGKYYLISPDFTERIEISKQTLEYLDNDTNEYLKFKIEQLFRKKGESP